MLAQHYAQAIFDAKKDATAEVLVRLLKQKGHSPLLPQIVREYEKLLRKDERASTAEIRVSNKSDIARLKDRIASYETELAFSANDARIVEDPSIVGGFIIKQGAREVDGSFRARLIKLYRNLIAVTI